MSKAKDGRNTDTRQRILLEAETLYHLGGYEHINLQTIADTLQVSKPALFYHFANKQELFFVMLINMLERIHQRLSAAIDQDTAPIQEKLRRIMYALMELPTFDVTRFTHEEIHLLTDEQQREIGLATHAHLFAPIESIFAEGIHQGELKLHEVKLSSRLFLNMCIPFSHPKSPLRFSLKEENGADEWNKLLHMFLFGLVNA